MYPKKYTREFTTVLMLDSEEKLLEAIKTHFFIKNIQIITTSYIEVALSTLKKTLPDCIVIDTAMPNNIGLKFIQELKKNKDYNYIPFILLTTRGLTEDRIKGYNLGCSAYIPKPFDPEELEAIIRNIILKSEVFYEFILAIYILIKETRLEILDTYRASYTNLRLTKREQFILRELLAGKNSLELSLKLRISLRCVEKYVTRILNKTNTKNIIELRRICCFFL
jgi:DNA-binding NarL/FixJ family response regulator